MKYLLFFILLLTSCEVDDPNCPYEELPILVDASNELTANAINIWNEAMGVVVFENSPDGVAVEFVDSLPDFKRGFATWTCSNGFKTKAHVKVIPVESGPGITTSVICHELGHVIGMQHTKEGIMQRIVPPIHTLENVLEMTDYFFDLYPEYE